MVLSFFFSKEKRGFWRERKKEEVKKENSLSSNLPFLTNKNARTQSDTFSSALRSLGPTKPTPDVRTPRYEAVVAGGTDE